MVNIRRSVLLYTMLLLLTCGVLQADYYSNSVLVRQPASARQIAMGYQSCGAYIWSQNPLTALNNPALLSYQNGFRYALSRYIHSTDTVSNTTSYVGFGGNGWGILLPSGNMTSGFGNDLEIEEEHFSISTQYYGLGINLSKLSDLRLGAESDPRVFNFSMGFSLIRYAEDQWGGDDYSGESLDGGVLMEITPTAVSDKPVDFSITAAADFYNIFQGEIENRWDHSEPLIYGMVLSAASRIAYRTDKVENEMLKKV